MTIKDSNRLLTLTTPLGDSVLLVNQFSGTEKISDLFHFSLKLFSETADVNFSKLVGQPITLHLELPGGGQRHWNGLVSRFAQIASDNGYFWYEATMVPWFWVLRYTQNCRIFQEQSVPDIIEAVFKARGLNDFKNSLSGSYTARPYCVQYRESDFNFVNRLMEEEGIFYYFEHQADKHTLILADSVSAIQPCPVKATVAYRPVAGATPADDIFTWPASLTVVPASVSLQSYDFEKPSTDLTANASSVAKQAKMSALDIYDYQPGRYQTVADGERYAKLVIEEYEARQLLVEGSGQSRTFAAGYGFTLEKHYRQDCNADYLLLSVEHQAQNSLPWIDQTPDYQNNFVCQRQDTPYRPSRNATKPLVRGVQTALVVGPTNEEIYTDKYGRVKVQFRWDRQGKKDDKSSCWIRVSQGWAGLTLGSIYLPRVGQEVLVEFIEGDPDQPLITGRVYNAEKMPPYDLPGANTQSGIKTRSTPNGTAENFNELRFEDKKGSEQIYVQAEKDFQRLVKNDDSLEVQHDRSESVKNNRTITVTDGDDQHSVNKGNRTVVVDKGDDTLTINAGNQTTSVKNNRTVTVADGDDQHDVNKGNRTVVLGAGNDTLTIKTGNQTTQVKVGSSSTEALQSIEFKVGQNSITISQSGISIKGMTVTIQGQIQVQVKAPMTQVNGDAMLTLKGGITMIN